MRWIEAAWACWEVRPVYKARTKAGTVFVVVDGKDRGHPGLGGEVAKNDAEEDGKC